MSQRFSDQAVLVTAGASGIGAAAAEAFARDGARLMVSDINVAAGEAVVERLRGGGAEAHFMRADATIEEDIERLIRKTVETLGALDVAANVVGDVHPGAAGPEFHQQSLASWEATLAVSLRSTFLSMKHEIARMIAAGDDELRQLVNSQEGALDQFDGVRTDLRVALSWVTAAA